MSCAPFHAISASARGLRFFPNWMADIWAPCMDWNLLSIHCRCPLLRWFMKPSIVFLNWGFLSFDTSLNVCIATGRSGWEMLENEQDWIRPRTIKKLEVVEWIRLHLTMEMICDSVRTPPDTIVSLNRIVPLAVCRSPQRTCHPP